MKSENSTAQIKCTNYSHIDFSQSQYILITNLEFVGCGGNQVKYIEGFMVQNAKFTGEENTRTVLILIETVAQIINSTFVSNKKGSYRECASVSEYGCYSDGFIGGAVFATNSAIDISQSKFEHNRADFGGAIYAEQHSVIYMSGNVFINNSATQYGGVLHSSSSTITIEENKFQHNSANRAGVLESFRSNIIIEESEFQNNSAIYGGGAMYFFSSNIIIEENEFQHNSATY